MAPKVQLVVLVSAFVMVSTVWFAVFLLHTMPSRAQPFVKVGARAPVPYGVSVDECTTRWRDCSVL